MCQAPTAVIACVPFNSARPSFAVKLQRLQSGPRKRLSAGDPLATIERFAFANNHQRQMRQRRQIATRSHGTLFRDHRMHPGIQHSQPAIPAVPARTPLNPFASTFARSSNIARASASASGSPHPARMATYQVDLQLRKFVARNPHIRQLPEPGVHSIHRFASVKNALNQAAALSNPS